MNEGAPREQGSAGASNDAGGPEDPAHKTPRRRRLRGLPGRAWALIVVPVIPIIASAVVAQILKGGPPRVATSVKLEWVKAEDEHVQLSKVLEERRNDPAFDRFLGCEAVMFAVQLAFSGSEPEENAILRWTLIEPDVTDAWEPPPSFETLRSKGVSPESGVHSVWVPMPNSDGRWIVRFDVFRSAEDVPG
jgi:hypothetical protein